MTAATHDLTIDQGATFAIQVGWYEPAADGSADLESPIDLAGYDARLQIRRRHTAPSPVISLTVGDGLTITSDDGLIDIAITAETTGDLTPGTYVYDLEIESSAGEVTRLLEGLALVSPEVTR